jgi:pyruvate formate lyase activating enzyme
MSRYQKTLDDQTKLLRCTLCPKSCQLSPGSVGACRVRQNQAGNMICLTYGSPCAINIDPIEKKPLFHVLPGSPTLSIATPGCNLTCLHCQNWHISQTGPQPAHATSLTPHELVIMAVTQKTRSIAYTYTEPLISFEYTLDCCKAASTAGLKNLLVTAAYINPDPLREIAPYVDAANVDLKAFSNAFYRDICGASLQPILHALQLMHQMNIFLEITTLLIPTLNDQPDELRKLCDWIVEKLGPGTPLHLSRFYPQHKLSHLPPTPPELLYSAREIAHTAGLQYVYLGNLSGSDGENTFCPHCNALLIERKGYTVVRNRLNEGACPDCSTTINGLWS